MGEISRKHNLKVGIYPYATELYEKLDSMGIINRVKEVPQLDVIKVSKRYDYIYVAVVSLSNDKESFAGTFLRLTYNNYVVAKEFRNDYEYIKKNKPSIGDILQLLMIFYNIGYFYNTSTASRAVTILSSEVDTF